jgi:transcription termination/antitermination protein NusG
VSPEENKESKPEEPVKAPEVPLKAPEPKVQEDDRPQPVKQSRPRGQDPLPEPEEPKEIFAVKTSIGHEKIVADMIAARAKKRDADVYAILSPQKLRGYVLVEGKGMERLRTLIKGLPKVRGVVQGDKSIALDDILGQLEPTSTVEGINEGDIVELISGPFKGEKARVEQIDKSKEEITVALIEAIVKIPVTVKGEAVRILEKEKEEEK